MDNNNTFETISSNIKPIRGQRRELGLIELDNIVETISNNQEPIIIEYKNPFKDEVQYFCTPFFINGIEQNREEQVEV